MKTPLFTLAFLAAAAAHAQTKLVLPPPGTPYLSQTAVFAGVAGLAGNVDLNNRLWATFDRPTLIATDGGGRFWVVDGNGTTIREIGTKVRTLQLTRQLPSYDLRALVYHPPTQSLLLSWYSPPVYFNGSYYSVPGEILRIQLDGTVSTFSTLTSPLGLAVHSNGVVVVSDATGALHVLDEAGNIIETWQLGASMRALAFDQPRNKLYGLGGYSVQVVDLGTRIKSTFAGSGGSPGFVDGDGTTARFTDPHGIAVDEQGNVFVTDNGWLRQVTPAVYGTRGGSALNHPTLVATVTNLPLAEPHGLVRWGTAFFFTDRTQHTIEYAR